MKKTNIAGKIRYKIQTVAAALTIMFAHGAVAYANVSLSPTPSSINFGSQSVSSTSPSQPVTLTNYSKHQVTIYSVSVSIAQFYYSGPSLPVNLNPGQSLTGSVTFTPSAVQAYSGTLIFTRSNGPTISAALSGIGVISASAAVAPSITTQPVSQTVIAGNTASFAVAATGTAPLTYQWSKNGAAISGATSSTYTTPAETTADNNAQFTVAVGNSAGTATSNAAILTVSAATLLLNSGSSSLSFGSVNVSSSSTQTAALTNSGNSSVTISNVTVSGAGFNASGVSSGLILAPGQAAILTVTFAPFAAGSVTGSVSVASNASNSPDTISLSGTGVSVVNHSVALSWSPSTSTMVVGYNAYSSAQPGGPYTKLTSTPVAATSYTDTAVQSAQTYYFVVTAVDSSNVESAYSAEVSAVIP